MKNQLLQKLEPGDRVEAQIIELLAQREFIVSVYGELIRAHNYSARELKKGDFVTLSVLQVAPFNFRIVDDLVTERSARLHLDRRA